MNTLKKTALTGAAAAALLVVGVATPAMASDDTSTTSKWYEIQKHTSFSNTSPVVIAPDVDLLSGGVANGDNLNGNLNGNVVGSGNDVLTGDVASGNDTAIGNDVIDNTVSDLVDSNVSDLVDDVTDVSDVVDVSDVLGDVSGWVNLEGMFED